jgi:thiol-disulfide isomerase/thioredoxin
MFLSLTRWIKGLFVLILIFTPISITILIEIEIFTMTLSIKFYTKPKCSLCDEVRIFLSKLAKEYSLDVEEVNILNDPTLYEHYKYEIPVLSFPDLSQLQGKIEPKRLREKLDLVFKK